MPQVLQDLPGEDSLGDPATSIEPLTHQGNPNNKNPETETGIQSENQKSKAAKPLEKSYLCQGWVTVN